MYSETLKKKNFLIALGYNYESIWESDWRRVIKVITRFKRLIKNKMKQ